MQVGGSKIKTNQQIENKETYEEKKKYSMKVFQK